ncbi:MAG: hypothetical protein MRJ96_03645 [Nitrospirales bacterium]|nr:hypothetical protein [Nitrospira sp.]MDR4500532.1 hypothetical protein [Nitrospirales bacterium]
MSIITDALNRLQSARGDIARPAAHDPVPMKAEEPKPSVEVEQSGDTEKPKHDARFVTVSLGGFLLVATVALGAYWWGESLVLDLPQATPHEKSTGNPSSGKNAHVQMNETVSVNSRPQTAERSVAALSNDPSPKASVVTTKLDDHSLKPSGETQEKLVMSLSREASAEPVLEENSVPVTVASLASRGKAPTSSTREVKVREAVRTPENIDGLGQNQRSGSDALVAATVADVADVANESPMVGDDSQKTEELPRSNFSLLDSSSGDTGTQEIVRVSGHEARAEEYRKPNDRLNVAPIPTKQEASGTASDFTHHSHDNAPENSSQVKTTDSTMTSSETRSSSHQQTSPQAEEPQKNSSVAGTADEALSSQQRLVKARLLIGQNAHAEAITVLQPLFTPPPASWEPWFWMGTAQLGVGNLDKAEESFMEGLVRDDSVGYLWVQRAVVAQQRGNFGKAMDALRQAELLAPKLPEVHLNLAYNLEYQGNARLAHQHYQEYLSLTEGKPMYHTVRRKVLERVLRLGSS